MLTGGGANQAGLEEAAKELLGLPTKIGRPEGFTGIADKISSPSYATPVGLMLENMGHARREDKANVKISHTMERLKKTFKHLLP